jgi:hypothetical protein
LATGVVDSAEVQQIDAAVSQWRQGDLALEESWFVHVADTTTPLSEAAVQADGDGIQALTSEVAGLVVVTQTCDIVRSCTTRPYVEVSPLVQVSEADFHQVLRGRRPAHATLPKLEKDNLVADLDRVMTVEKSIVSRWKRTPGCSDDADCRRFAQALARKRVRFAFPDDFTTLVRRLQSRLTDKHEKSTDEGRALRALREIRVLASPSWDAPYIDICFWFVRDDSHANFEGKSWADLLDEWLKLVPTAGRFQSVEGEVVTLQDLNAGEYVDSDPFDLDHLSADSSR